MKRQRDDALESMLDALRPTPRKTWQQTTRYACPDCHTPIRRVRQGKDGRCRRCRRDPVNLPVNHER